MINNTALVVKTIAPGFTVSLQPNPQHAFLMDTQQVANGFGISSSNLRSHKSLHSDELVEGKHYLNINRVHKTDAPLDRVSKTHALNNKTTYWTKRGIVRLGFFIKSERAKQFRDWAEDYIIEEKAVQPSNHELLMQQLKTRFAKQVTPVTINGRPFYPIRSVSRMLGLCGNHTRNVKAGKDCMTIGAGKAAPWYINESRLKQYLLNSTSYKAHLLYQALYGVSNELFPLLTQSL